ncbi:ABC-2 type transporter domain-containing protein [Ditylenchus destructor]|nr:ABC-2 type transporter domain-containing protein [Ditylenchus destructor]
MGDLMAPSEGISLLSHGLSERLSICNTDRSVLEVPSDSSALKNVSGTSLSWHNITVTDKKSDKKILNNVSGKAEAGEFVALMGASGYVQQDELFLATLTVREHLMIQARLRLVDMNEEEMNKRVDDVILALGLYNSQDKSLGIGNNKITLGESRRVCFATELLDNPSLLFCDEPTTGLDITKAQSVVNIMKDLSKKGGRTIICTIHQPSSEIFRKFDKNSNQGVEFLEAVEKCKDRTGKSPEMRQKAGFWRQLRALLYRSFLDNWRNKALTRAKLVQKVSMGLFLGLLYLKNGYKMTPVTRRNVTGVLYFLCIEVTYPTLFGILLFLPSEFQLLRREYHNGLYDVSSYFISRAISYMPLFTIDGLVMVSIAYWMIGLAPIFTRFLLTLVICALVEQSAAAFGMMLSTVCPSYAIAISVSGPVLTVLTLTGGLYANVGEIKPHARWIQYLSWFRYGFEALMVNQWEGLASLNSDRNITLFVENQVAQNMTVNEILHEYTFSSSWLFPDMGILVCLMLGYYLIGFVALLVRVRMNR